MAIRYAPGIYSIRNTAPAGKTEATVTIDNKPIKFYSQTSTVVRVCDFMSSDVATADLVIQYQGADYTSVIATSEVSWLRQDITEKELDVSSIKHISLKLQC